SRTRASPHSWRMKSLMRSERLCPIRPISNRVKQSTIGQAEISSADARSGSIMNGNAAAEGPIIASEQAHPNALGVGCSHCCGTIARAGDRLILAGELAGDFG